MVKILGGANMNYPYELQKLNYAYDALEPSISKKTMEFHHDKHLQSYVNNLNAALEKEIGLQQKNLDDILKNIDQISSVNATAICNNGGGVFNHNFYFEGLAAPLSTNPSEYMEEVVSRAFGSLELFKEEFKKAGLAQFGSGWAWLVIDAKGKLKIVNTANQDTPLKHNMTPLLNIDVWEHAYYLDYQNRRPDYVEHYFDIINWDVVEQRLRDYYAGNTCRISHG